MNQQNKIHGAVTDYRFSVSQVPAEVKRCASTRRKDLTSNKYGVSAGSPSDLGSWAVRRFLGLPNGLWRSRFLQLFPLLQSLAFGGWSVVGVQCLWRRCCWRPEVGLLSSWVQCCEVGVWFAGDGLASLMGVWFFWWLYDLRWLIWVVLRGVAIRAWFLCSRRRSNRFWYRWHTVGSQQSLVLHGGGGYGVRISDFHFRVWVYLGL